MAGVTALIWLAVLVLKGLWTLEVGGRIEFHAEDGKQAFAGSYGLPGSVRSPHGL